MGSVVVGSGVCEPLVRGSGVIRLTAGSSGACGSIVNACEVIGSGYVFRCRWIACQWNGSDGFHRWWFKCLVKCVRSTRFKSWWL